MKKPVIVTKTSWKEFDKVRNLGLTVYESMNLNPNFINPQPALSVVKSCTDDLIDAIATWGQVGNRGSHESYVDVQLKSRVLHLRLTQLSGWCMSSLEVGLSYVSQTSILSTSGFPIKNPGAPVGRLQVVVNLHRFISRALNQGQVKLKWSKPLDAGTSSNVKSYIVYRSATNIFSTSSVIASVTKTTYIDNPGSGTWFYWVLGTNTEGYGAVSPVLMVQNA